jgi:ATP synthase I chain
MSNTANYMDSSPASTVTDQRLHARVFRVMVGATALAVLGASLMAPWRVATGLLLGGLLALLNHQWLRTSVSTAFALALGKQKKPRIKIAGYLFRYLVIGTVTFAAYKLRIASLPAIIAGLCTFVVALFAEALREFYFVIIQREGIN